MAGLIQNYTKKEQKNLCSMPPDNSVPGFRLIFHDHQVARTALGAGLVILSQPAKGAAAIPARYDVAAVFMPAANGSQRIKHRNHKNSAADRNTQNPKQYFLLSQRKNCQNQKNQQRGYPYANARQRLVHLRPLLFKGPSSLCVQCAKLLILSLFIMLYFLSLVNGVL